jgi:hypothetical protein
MGRVWSRGRRVMESTRVRDDSDIDSLILPQLGKRQLGKVTPAHLRTWIADLVKAGKSPATISRGIPAVGRHV